MSDHIQPLAEARDFAGGYIWRPNPFNVWVGIPPHNRLQRHVLEAMRERLEARGCLFVETPDQPTELGPVAQLGITFGRDLEEEISPLAVLGKMPKPRGMMLAVNTAERIPNLPLFDLARGQLVRKAGHIGVLVEGNLDGAHIERALWASMAGNNRLLEGDEESIVDHIALRVQAHVSAEKVTNYDGDALTAMSWRDWGILPVHAEIARAAHALGRAGIIEDEVPLSRYGTTGQVRSVLNFLKRAALGEGMRSQIDLNWRMMGVTTSGGNKINVSPDPHEGHVVPVSQLTWSGYVRGVPADCPVTYVAPSVETHENGMVYLASGLLNAGQVDSLDSFLAYLGEHFARQDRIDILPEGLTPKVTAIDHFHRQPKAGSIKEPERVEIVYPDAGRFPEIDFPCGVREAEMHLLSAVFQSEFLRQPGPLGDRAIMAVLPGHGSVALYGGARDELTEVLVSGMEMEEIVRI